MACTCRDSTMVNPKVWVNAFSSCLLNRQDTQGFRMPALYEVLPDMFFSPFCLKQATRQGSIPQQDRASKINKQCTLHMLILFKFY